MLLKFIQVEKSLDFDSKYGDVHSSVEDPNCKCKV